MPNLGDQLKALVALPGAAAAAANAADTAYGLKKRVKENTYNGKTKSGGKWVPTKNLPNQFGNQSN